MCINARIRSANCDSTHTTLHDLCSMMIELWAISLDKAVPERA